MERGKRTSRCRLTIGQRGVEESPAGHIHHLADMLAWMQRHANTAAHGVHKPCRGGGAKQTGTDNAKEDRKNAENGAK